MILFTWRKLISYWNRFQSSDILLRKRYHLFLMKKGTYGAADHLSARCRHLFLFFYENLIVESSLLHFWSPMGKKVHFYFSESRYLPTCRSLIAMCKAPHSSFFRSEIRKFIALNAWFFTFFFSSQHENSPIISVFFNC